MTWKEVVEQINLVGGQYAVHDETGESFTQDICDSLVFLHEVNGLFFFLFRPIGWSFREDRQLRDDSPSGISVGHYPRLGGQRPLSAACSLV